MMRSLRQTLPSIGLTTYVDCPAWRSGGNRAYEGRAPGPPRVNLCHLIPIGPSNLANTIVHETAHRAGYSHPSVKRSWSLANCEPPYLVGSLVRSIGTSTRIDHLTNNCAYLMTVAVDVVPSPVSLMSTANLEVFILSTPTLNARRLTLLTLGNGVGTEAPAVARSAQVVDHNGDGLKDLRVLFSAAALRANDDLTARTTHLTVRAAHPDGRQFEGSAAVTIAP